MTSAYESSSGFRLARARTGTAPHARALRACVVLSTALAAALVTSPSATAGEQELPQEVAQLMPISPGAGDELGRSVSYREPFLISGAWGASSQGSPQVGHALVWRWHPNGWILEAQLHASDAAEGDRFAGAVAVSRPTLLLLPRSAAAVGAHGADVAGHADSGAAYVFRRDLDGLWVQEAKLVPSDPQDNAQFGRAVAMDGDLIAVGAPQRNNFRGAVYLFRMSLDQGFTPHWTQEAILTPTGVFAGDSFGTCVAIAGDRVVAGAPGDDIGTSINRGAAYVFQKQGANWVQTAQLKDPAGQQQDEFGRTIAIDSIGKEIVIGNSPTLTSNLSSAFIFSFSGSAWTLTKVLAPKELQVGDGFAQSVSIDSSFVAVGAPSRKVDGGSLRGAVFFWRSNEFGWSFDEVVVDASGAVGDSFGSAVSVSGEGAIVGAKGVDQSGVANAGALFVEWIVDCNEDFEFNLCDPGEADLDGDGFVNGSDLGSLLGLWGTVEPFAPGDLNGDGGIDGDDLGVMLGSWTG